MMNELVSVIVPTYSRPDNLCRAIDSLLYQTYTPIEIIVVDDNGEGTPAQKETEKLLENYISSKFIRYIKHSYNRNGAAARNTGVKAANGKYISLMDDDDTFAPNKIELQVKALCEALKRDKKYQGCYCSLDLITKNGKRTSIIQEKEGNLSAELLLGTVRFNSSTILITREAYEKINGFDERFVRNQDWEFCIRFFSRFKFALASPSTILVEKYQYGGNAIFKDVKKQIELKQFFLKEMKQYIDVLPQRNEIYHVQWTQLVIGLVGVGSWSHVIKFSIKACSYKWFSFKDVCDIFKSAGRYIKYSIS